MVPSEATSRHSPPTTLSSLASASATGTPSRPATWAGIARSWNGSPSRCATAGAISAPPQPYGRRHGHDAHGRTSSVDGRCGPQKIISAGIAVDKVLAEKPRIG